MSELRIDFVAPPFAGHLFPLLELASYLESRGYRSLRVLTTRRAASAVRAAGLELVPLLEGEERSVEEIADTTRRVGSNPFRLAGQLRRSLTLMRRLKEELVTAWGAGPPDLAIVDFALPLAGIVAQERGIRWWTSMPTPCALETRTGTPSYLGGWLPPRSVAGRWRDAAGRACVRGFKRTVFAMFRRSLGELGFRELYRADGSEAVYSPERILGLGIKEFELDQDRPDCFEFVGPLTACPAESNERPVEPAFEQGRRHVLVSLGTHLGWAKLRALKLVCDAASRTPEIEYHFSFGRAFEPRGFPQACDPCLPPNVQTFSFVPYDRWIDRYDAAIVHGGTGILYACLRAAVPMLVWPHDYDQFDHAARIVCRGLGRRCRPRGALIAADLLALMSDDRIRENTERFSGLVRSADATRRIEVMLEEMTGAAN